ncbi:MAG: hypothetical protein ABI413_14735 [Ktedonobacteraceae bacterium]
MPMSTQAHKLLALRETYAQKAQALRTQRQFSRKQIECQMQGRYRTLDEVVAALSGLTAEMKPKQVQPIVQALLEKLAEHKAAGLVFYTRDRIRYGIDQLDEWITEGALQQIDAVLSKLCACLSPQWQAQPWKHGCYFQVYHYLAERAFDDAEAIARWHSKTRTQWYLEAAIIEVAPANTLAQRLEEVFLLTNHVEENWTQGQAVFWVQRDMPVRSTSQKDVIASVLSGSAWIVDRIGFQPLQ